MTVDEKINDLEYEVNAWLEESDCDRLMDIFYNILGEDADLFEVSIKASHTKGIQVQIAPIRGKYQRDVSVRKRKCTYRIGNTYFNGPEDFKEYLGMKGYNSSEVRKLMNIHMIRPK